MLLMISYTLLTVNCSADGSTFLLFLKSFSVRVETKYMPRGLLTPSKEAKIRYDTRLIGL